MNKIRYLHSEAGASSATPHSIYSITFSSIYTMVKINFKTVQNKVSYSFHEVIKADIQLFSLEAEGSETVSCRSLERRVANNKVGDLKKKIQESQTFPVENQKLIYSG